MRHKVDQLVDTCAGSLDHRIGFTFLRRRFGILVLTDTLSLHDVVVFLGTVDLSEEAERLATKVGCQLLDRLLQPVGLLLAETDASPLEDTSLLHQVLNLGR